MEDLHQTSIKKVSRSFPCLCVKKGFEYWGDRLKVVYLRSRSTYKFNPSLLVRRVLFPNNRIGDSTGDITLRVPDLVEGFWVVQRIRFFVSLFVCFLLGQS
jgi:hypothetical protein